MYLLKEHNIFCWVIVIYLTHYLVKKYSMNLGVNVKYLLDICSKYYTLKQFDKPQKVGNVSKMISFSNENFKKFRFYRKYFKIFILK